MTGPITDSRGQIVKASRSGSDVGLVKLLQSMQGEIVRALPRHLTPDRMARIVLTALRTTKNLDKCTPVSFAGCVMSLAQLGLEPNTPLMHAWLIPRNNRKRGCIECTTIIGYQGMIELARRSGMVKGIEARTVRDGDEFAFEYGLQPTLIHVPSRSAGRESRPITYAYSVCRVKDAEPAFEVLSIEQIEARRRSSAASDDGPWITNYEPMVRKTAVRAIWPYVPKSAEMAYATQIDHAAERGAPIVSTLDDSARGVLMNLGLDVDAEEKSAMDAESDGEDVANGRRGRRARRVDQNDREPEQSQDDQPRANDGMHDDPNMPSNE